MLFVVLHSHMEISFKTFDLYIFNQWLVLKNLLLKSLIYSVVSTFRDKHISSVTKKNVFVEQQQEEKEKDEKRPIYQQRWTCIEHGKKSWITGRHVHKS